MKRFQVAVFGKQGCDKCKLLKKRLAKILEEESYADFEMEYYDLGTVEGLVRFCSCEVLNPQRIPSFMVFQRNSSRKEELLPIYWRKRISAEEEIETFLALETDYKSTGVISPKMIREILDQALQTALPVTG